VSWLVKRFRRFTAQQHDDPLSGFMRVHKAGVTALFDLTNICAVAFNPDVAVLGLPPFVGRMQQTVS
jgi:hypothetical protein